MLDEKTARKFWKHAEKADGCWLWTGPRYPGGYGAISVSHNQKLSAHRASWLIHFGEIPDGLCVLHRCDVPPCVRPSHLFLGTKRDNILDCVAKGRLCCKRGEDRHFAKLTADKVREILKLRAEGLSLAQLARRFGVSETTVQGIVSGKKWKHVGSV